jgi:hypothetical protein
MSRQSMHLQLALVVAIALAALASRAQRLQNQVAVIGGADDQDRAFRRSLVDLADQLQGLRRRSDTLEEMLTRYLVRPCYTRVSLGTVAVPNGNYSP